MSSSSPITSEAATNLMEGSKPSAALSEQRVRFLAGATQQLLGSLDLDTTARTAARLSVPAFSDVCVVELVGADGRLTPVARAEAAALHVDPLSGSAGSASLVVPLEARGRTLGALHLSTAASGRRYGPADRALAEDFAARTALALDNALLHQRLEEALRQRDEFIVTAAHDLNTPLAVLKLQAQSLLRGPAGHVDETVRKRAAAIDRQVHHLTHMVGNLLHASSMSAAGVQLLPEDTDLRAVAREVVTRFEAQAAWVRTPLSLHAPEPLPGYWDRARLDQVLTNLVSNALKYGCAQPVEVRVERDGACARVAVRDGGIGIAPERQERIWEKFGRAVDGRQYAGLGLGLWIVKRLVEAMGGTVAVESRPGLGSTFSVELPLPTTAPDDRTREPPRPNEDAPT
jgi:signal transduction histidine kinase